MMNPTLTIFAALLLAPLALCAARDPARPEKPNVLMIIADDLNDWVGCLQGHPAVKTPNLDRLAKRGMLFANAQCAAPVCNPARVGTLTGQRPSSSGVYGNDTVWHEALPGVATIPQHFRANGYHVAGGSKVYHHPPLLTAPSTNHLVRVQVTDDGQPPLSDEEEFTINVPVFGRPHLQSVTMAGCDFMLEIHGVAGPDYTLQGSGDLQVWTNLHSWFSPVIPFVWTNSETGAFERQFYRILSSP